MGLNLRTTKYMDFVLTVDGEEYPLGLHFRRITAAEMLALDTAIQADDEMLAIMQEALTAEADHVRDRMELAKVADPDADISSATGAAARSMAAQQRRLAAIVKYSSLRACRLLSDLVVAVEGVDDPYPEEYTGRLEFWAMMGSSAADILATYTESLHVVTEKKRS